jgi:hypothetical protein
MKKATLNLVVDAVIGLAFTLSAVIGLVFLIPQNASTVPTVLGLDLLVWSELHTYASLGMIGGVLLHLALHARWIAGNVRRTLGAAAAERKVMHTQKQITQTKRGLA